MRFEVTHSLQRLGEPVPQYFKREALGTVAPFRIREVRDALRNLDDTRTVQELKELIKVV